MNLKHTPGPWIAEAHRDSINIFGDGFHIASVPSEDKLGYLDTPNARLIAAAPDMIAALRELLAADKFAENIGVTLDDHMNRQARMALINAAIAKAEIQS